MHYLLTMAKNLTKKQRGFVKDYLATGNGTQAALKNYNTTDTNTAAVMASDTLRIPKVANAIADALKDDDLAKKHKELLEQKQLAYFTFPKTMEDEEITEHVTAAGMRVIVIRPSDKGKLAFYSIEDGAVRSKALDMAYKIKGTYAPEKSVNLNLQATVPDSKLLELAQQLNDLRKNNT